MLCLEKKNYLEITEQLISVEKLDLKLTFNQQKIKTRNNDN